ncbi:MAG: glycoside hydrolase family 127 protein [Dysgonamonadaceae bacterium]|jgi:DUF1680 family protein|nr:glycoside hydrolase family 127 protein [Dysgonamonadaceae bacterium]
MKNNFLLLILVLAMMPNHFFAQAKLKVEDRQFPLPPGSIKLSGFLENDIQNSIEHWNKGVVPYADMVDFFRNGRKQFALGEMWGKSVRSACMFYRYTQDTELKRIIDTTVADLLTTERQNGSISCVPPEQQPEMSDLWERKYVMLGLEEYYEWVNPEPRILESLKRQADAIIAVVGHSPKTEIIDVGWSATMSGYEPCHIESSSLLEPFMRLYKWTGEQRYLDFAAYIVEMGGTKQFNVFEAAFNNVEPHKMAGHYPKAYEMTSVFEGLVEFYRATGNDKWKQTLLNYLKNIREKEITVIGNGGGDQPYHPAIFGEAWDNTAIEQANPDMTRMMETCVGVTWMKFCSQMLRLTNEASIADEIEKYIYNGLRGAMKPTGDGFSYVNLLNGQKVNDHGWGWTFGNLHVTCCNLNGPMGLAYIPYIAITQSADGAVVNLYNAATVRMATASGNPLNLSIETDYPQSGKVSIKVNPEKPESFALKLRIPRWSANTSLKVNGKKQAVTAGTYASIKRQWKAGDKVEITFDFQCRLLASPQGGSNPKADNRQALIYGPFVLVRDENIDKDFNQPVTIKANKNGIVKIVAVKPTLPTTQFEFNVPTATGSIRMVDYASVNGWNGSHICTWIPKTN